MQGDAARSDGLEFGGEETRPFVLPFIRWADIAYLENDAPGVWPRRIYDHEFVYVLRGQGKIVIEGVAHDARPDRLFLVQPRVWHAYLAQPGESLTLLGIHFDWSPRHDTLTFPIFKEAPKEAPADEELFRSPASVAGWDLTERMFLDLGGRTRVRQLMEDIVAEYAREDAESRELAGALLAGCILQIEREMRRFNLQKAEENVGPDAWRRVERARALLETVGRGTPSIEAVAVEIGWSADHLRRMFRQAFGSSPQEIQTAARVRQAKELLRGGNCSVSQVAEKCGFEDPSYFARIFKKESGLSPRQFLALARKV